MATRRTPPREGAERKGKNVFQLWSENGRRVPFAVQKFEWAKDSYFIVTEIELSMKQEEYFQRTGNLYGKAFGHFYRKGVQTGESTPQELRNSGVYKWRHVLKKDQP